MRGDVLSALKWTAAGRFSAQILQLLTTLVTIRLLSPEDFGTFAVVMAPVTVLHALAVVAPTGLIIQRPNLSAADIASILAVQALLAGAGVMILAAVIPVLAWSFDDRRLLMIGYLLLVAFYVPSIISTALQSLFERDLVFKRISLIEFTAGLTALFSTLGLVISGAGIWSLAIGICAGSTIQALALIWLCRASLRLKMELPRLAHADIKYGLQLCLGISMTHGFGMIETFLLARGLGTTGLGLWRTSFDLISLPYSKLMPIINRVGFPAYARVGRDMPAIRHYVDLSLRMTGVVFVPVFWGIATVAHLMIPVVMGPQWSAAAPVASILATYLPLRLLQFCLILPNQGLGNVGLVNWANFLISVSSVLGLAGAVWFGPVPGALGMVILSTVGITYASHLSMGRIGMVWRQVLQPLFSCTLAGVTMVIVVCAAAAFLPSGLSDPAALAVLVSVGACSYVAVFLLIDRGELVGRLRPLVGEFWK